MRTLIPTLAAIVLATIPAQAKPLESSSCPPHNDQERYLCKMETAALQEDARLHAKYGQRIDMMCHSANGTKLMTYDPPFHTIWETGEDGMISNVYKADAWRDVFRYWSLKAKETDKPMLINRVTGKWSAYPDGTCEPVRHKL